MVQNALDLSVSVDAGLEENEAMPVWAANAVTAMAENGIALDALATMNRGQVAEVLYQVSQIAPEAPGMAVIRMQQ